MKALLKKIEEINSMIPAVNNLGEMPVTYAGGTWPYLVSIQFIEVENQYVTIKSNTNRSSFIDGKEKYNMNKTSVMGDEYCSKHLNYTLNTILKAFKKALK
jgi:hypothetical protein